MIYCEQAKAISFGFTGSAGGITIMMLMTTTTTTMMMMCSIDSWSKLEIEKTINSF